MTQTKIGKIGVIYMYTSPSKKMYIGQTINETSRKWQHKRKTLLTNTKFGNALKKYGFENFEYKVLIKFKPTLNIEKLKRVLNKLEDRYIKLYNSIELGYNLREGGECGIHSEESIQKMKDYANNMTEEHKINLSISSKKRYERDGLTENQDKALEYGRHLPCTEESKQKLKQSNSTKMKKVGKYDLEDTLIETFNSIADAARSLEGSTQKTKHNKIGDCCNNRSKSSYGYI